MLDGGELVFYVQVGRQFSEACICKLGTVVRGDGVWYSEPRNNVPI